MLSKTIFTQIYLWFYILVCIIEMLHCFARITYKTLKRRYKATKYNIKFILLITLSFHSTMFSLCVNFLIASFFYSFMYNDLLFWWSNKNSPIVFVAFKSFFFENDGEMNCVLKLFEYMCVCVYCWCVLRIPCVLSIKQHTPFITMLY